MEANLESRSGGTKLRFAKTAKRQSAKPKKRSYLSAPHERNEARLVKVRIPWISSYDMFDSSYEWLMARAMTALAYKSWILEPKCRMVMMVTFSTLPTSRSI